MNKAITKQSKKHLNISDEARELLLELGTLILAFLVTGVRFFFDTYPFGIAFCASCKGRTPFAVVGSALGALIFLFLLTWKGQLLLRYALSLASVFLYACTDELHQRFSQGRHASFTDVLIDLSGAAILCSLLLAAVLLLQRKQSKPTIYYI